MELTDLDNKNISTKMNSSFFGTVVQSTLNALFKSKYQPYSNYYYYILVFLKSQDGQNALFVRREYFESTTVQNIHDQSTNGPVCTNTNIISCFETSEYDIVCLFQNSENKLEIYGYSQTSDLPATENDLVENENGDVFFKCVHLKDKIGVFMYYLSTESTYPIISFKEYTAGSGASSYKNYFDSIELNEIQNLSPGSKLNDIMTISEDKYVLHHHQLTKECYI